MTENPNIINNEIEYYGAPRNSIDTTVIGKDGISRSYDANGKLLGTSTMWKPNKFRIDMEAGGNRYFYKAPMDFLFDAAKQYSKIDDTQEYKYRPTQDRDFVNALTSFFYNDKSLGEQTILAQKLSTEIDAAVRELATQIKNGENPDISKLKFTMTIGGVSVTFDQIKDMQEKSKHFFDVLGPANGGSSSMEDWGVKGLSKGAAMAYGDSLGGELGKLFNKAFGMAADENLQKSRDDYQWLLEVTGNPIDIPAKFGEQTYELFLKVRNQRDFDSAMDTFDSLLVKYNQAWKGSADSNHLATMRKVMMDANIMLDWK